MNTVYIEGLPAIGRTVGRTADTIRRWIRKESFPAGKLPNGNYFTSSALIDQWIVNRAHQERERRKTT